MTTPEHGLDRIVKKLETSLHLVQEMESLLEQIAGRTAPSDTGTRRRPEPEPATSGQPRIPPVGIPSRPGAGLAFR